MLELIVGAAVLVTLVCLVTLFLYLLKQDERSKRS